MDCKVTALESSLIQLKTLQVKFSMCVWNLLFKTKDDKF